MPSRFNIILCDRDRKVAVSHSYFTAANCDISTVTCDAVVSPANSFGYLGGGIDLIYADMFGNDLQRKLQSAIKTFYHGELPVGNAIVIKTEKPVPYFIAAPTMRVPSCIKGTLNAYLATKAALVAANAYQDIKTICFPGMGTGIGKLPIHIFREQFIAAIRDFYMWVDLSYAEKWAKAKEQEAMKEE